MFKRIVAALFIIFSLATSPFSSGGSKNPFATKPDANKQSSETKDKTQKSEDADEKTETKDQTEPGFFARIWQWFVRVQGQINRYLTTKIKTLKANFTIGTFFLVFFISVFYGFIHSIGPGHGKLVVTSYFLKDESNMKDLLLLSGIISIVHNLSAVLISALLAFLSNIDVLSGQNTARGVAMLISGIILVGIGIYYFINAFTHGHEHQPLEVKKQHSHEHPPHEAEKKHSHELAPAKANKIQKMSLWAVGLSAGIVPCPLSIAVIFFGLYLNAITIVIISVVAMSIGMAFTEFLFGFASMKMRLGILKLFKKNEKLAEGIHKFLSVAGATIIILFGIFIGASFFV